ncbi:hypothetical protein DdX_01115 [Ditylenchus destructor]|uniref:Uncharacterized protein n=1 Tax=Ditylenchus destructor TaxID=166010 RepID=A0AAD4NG84_9BILA|nr:hypothetical protein DdX_01115 [Ditylenchus destructor]
MHCLVSRPGYGLVSEKCPPNTVACRIRIEHSAIEFYDYSPLYDRNQFVCVMKNEYGNEERSGCLKKRTGRVRCWCYGRSNCNTAENSKRLYTAFVSGDERHFYSVAEEIDFADIASSNDDLEAAIKISTTKRYPFPSSTTTDAPSTVAPISNTKIASHMTIPRSTISPITSEDQINTQSSKATTRGGTEISDDNASKRLKSLRYGENAYRVGFRESSNSIGKPNSIVGKPKPSISLSTGNDNPHGQKHEHRTHIQPESQSTSVPKISITTTETTEEATKMNMMTRPPSGHKLIYTPRPVMSEFDSENRVHIIHVNARDEYEHVLGSEQFSNILNTEKDRLSRVSWADGSDNAGTSFDSALMYGDEKGDPDKRVYIVEPDDPHTSQHHSDFRKRQRNGLERVSGLQKETVNLEEDTLDGNLEEYFDSAFFAPVSCGIPCMVPYIIILICIATVSLTFHA